METSKGENALTSSSVVFSQRYATNQSRHSGPVYFSDSLFRNNRLKQKRLKWQLAISKKFNVVKRKNSKKTDNRRRYGKRNFSAFQPNAVIDLLSDDDDGDDGGTKDKTKQKAVEPTSNTTKQDQSLPQIIVFPGHMQLSKVPNITLIPVQPLSMELATSLQNRMRRKRKSQKPKRHAEPTIMNYESIVLSDDSGDNADAEIAAPSSEKPAACSTPTNIGNSQTPKSDCPAPPPQGYFNTTTNHIPTNNHHNENGDFKINSVQSMGTTNAPAPPPHSLQVDEEVTVSLVPRSASGSCSSSKGTGTNFTELFPMVPDETTVQTIISNRIYELSLSKLREGLATSGAGDFADEQKSPVQTGGGSGTARRKGTTFNLPATLKKPDSQPVSLKLSSDLSISLISDDEDDQQQQRLNAEKLLRQQPHLSVRPVGVITVRQPPKRRKLG